LLRQWCDITIVNLLEAFAPLPERLIGASGNIGNLAQGIFIELRYHGLAAGILVIGECPGIVPFGYAVAVGGANANRVDFQSVLGGIPGGINDAAFEVLAVGDKDKEFLVVRLAAECINGQIKGRGDVCAGAWNGVRIELTHRGLEGIMIERQWNLQKRFARKINQPKPVVRQLVGKVGDGQLGSLDTVWFHVLGEHALRAINSEKDVEPRAPFLLPVEEKVRPGHGREKQSHSGRKENCF